MDRWKYQTLEYKVKGGVLGEMKIDDDYLYQLNNLGRDGWELVGIIPFTENQGRLCKVHLVLKKPE